MDNIRRFYSDGFLEPFRAFDEADIRRLDPLLQEVRRQPSRIYGFPTNRDRHFDVPDMLAIMAAPMIIAV